jgi:hypothetical protein
MVFILYGYHFLFERSEDNNIGSHDRGMGFVVVFISTLLVGLEIVLIMMVFLRENPDDAFAMFLYAYAVQKIVQAILYILMRRRNPHPDFKRGTVFYFNFLAFLNFTLWLNSIPFTDIQIYDEVSHSPILQYVDQTFKALVIDYRLLCALLFFEHAMAIDENNENAENQHVHSHDDQEFQLPGRRKLYTAVGIVIGLGLLLFEIISSIQFWYGGLPDDVNLLPIVADIIVVVVGLCLLKNVETSVFHNKKVTLVLVMVTSMGATSIVYLYCFGILSFTSFKNDEPTSYVKWFACVYIARATSLLVLLIVYTGIPVNTMESRGNHNTKNYILVSALCSGLFARFIGSILDEFKGTMHHIAHTHLQANKLRSLRDLFAIGPLFQLAASLHLALHFLLMLCRLHEQHITAARGENVDVVQRPEGGNVQAVRNNYGAVFGVDRQPNGGGAVVRNGVARQRQIMRDEDSVFESTGVHPFQGAADERSSLLQPP